MNRHDANEFSDYLKHRRYKLLSIDELCEWLGFTRSQIYFWTSTDKIPHIKIERHLRFDPVQIQQWLDSKSNPWSGK